LFPLVQLPKKFKGHTRMWLIDELSHVSISSTSEEVQRFSTSPALAGGFDRCFH